MRARIIRSFFSCSLSLTYSPPTSLPGEVFCLRARSRRAPQKKAGPETPERGGTRRKLFEPRLVIVISLFVCSEFHLASEFDVTAGSAHPFRADILLWPRAPSVRRCTHLVTLADLNARARSGAIAKIDCISFLLANSINYNQV